MWLRLRINTGCFRSCFWVFFSNQHFSWSVFLGHGVSCFCLQIWYAFHLVCLSTCWTLFRSLHLVYGRYIPNIFKFTFKLIFEREIRFCDLVLYLSFLVRKSSFNSIQSVMSYRFVSKICRWIHKLYILVYICLQ